MSHHSTEPVEQSPQNSSPVIQAMREIATADRPEVIVSALHDHILNDVDYINLVTIRFGTSEIPAIQTVARWPDEPSARENELPEMAYRIAGQHQIIIPDVNQLDDLSPLRTYTKEVLKAASIAILPLVKQGTLAGYLIVATKIPYTYDNTLLETLEALLTQSALLLENLTLAHGFKHRTLQVQAVNELSLKVAAAPRQEELLDTLNKYLSPVFPVSHISLTALDKEAGRSIKLIYGQMLPDSAAEKDTLIDQVIRTGEPVHRAALGESDDPDSSLWMARDVNDLMIVPLYTRGRPAGTLNLGAREPLQFEVFDEILAEQIASLVSTALDTIELLSQLEDTLAEATALYSTALSMNTAQSFEEICRNLLTQVGYLSHANRQTLYMVGPDPHGTVEYLEAVAWWDNEETSFADDRERFSPAEVPVLSQFLQSQICITSTDAADDPRLDENTRRYCAEQGIKALMMLPVITGGIWMGAIIAEGHQDQVFTEKQMRLLRNITDQAALAMNSALLLQQARTSFRREQILREIIDRVRKASTAEEITEIVAGELSKVLDLPGEQINVAELSTEQVKNLGLSSDEKEFIESITDQVALALDNINLIENTRRTAIQQAIISNITAELQRSHSIDDVMKITVSALQSVLADYDITLRLAMPAPQEPPRQAADWADDNVT